MAGPGIVNGVRTVIPKGTYPTENHDALKVIMVRDTHAHTT